MNAHRPSRPGFTLVELLVVLALIVLLAAMAVVFVPNAANSQRDSRAATLLQGWLNVSKQRALRDQAPRGLRLLVVQTSIAGQSTPTVTQCQYIEQPDDFGATIDSSGQPTITLETVPNANNTPPYDTIGFRFKTSGDLTNGYPVPDTNNQSYLWAVQPGQQGQMSMPPQPSKPFILGDTLEIYGTGMMYNITSLTSNDHITIDPPLPYPITTPTGYFRILRAPRPVGDELLQFPEGALIDLTTNAKYGNALPINGNTIDIVFAPSGAVISRGLTNANINLWVRAPSEDPKQTTNLYYGTPTIVSIFAQTGAVGAYAPVPPPGAPYANVH